MRSLRTAGRGARAVRAGCLALLLLPGQFLSGVDERPLTLEMAVRLALTRNERSLATVQNVATADALVTKARSYFLPSISGTGTYTRRPFEVTRAVGGASIVIQRFNALYGVASLNLTLFNPVNIPNLLSARASQKSVADAAIEARRQLAFEVSQAFLSTLSTSQVLEAARRRYDFASQNLAAAKARYQGGLASINDVTKAELEFATAEEGVIQVQGQLETSILQLGFLLDAPKDVRGPLVVPEFLIQAAEAGPGDTEKLVVEAQARRLDLSSLRWLAKSQYALAITPTLRWFPSLGFNSQYTYTNESGLTGKPTNWNIGLTLSWSIFDGFSRNADYGYQIAQARLADLNVKASLRQVDIDVREAQVSLANQRAAYKQAVVADDAARKNASETAEMYRQGLASALDLAAANVSLFEAEVALVGQRYGLGVAFLNLEAALGLDPFGKEPKQ